MQPTPPNSLRLKRARADAFPSGASPLALGMGWRAAIILASVPVRPYHHPIPTTDGAGERRSGRYGMVQNPVQNALQNERNRNKT